MGLDAIGIDREVTLQDNKRTDLLIRYGLCNPIMVELKLLHNKEIQNKINVRNIRTSLSNTLMLPMLVCLYSGYLMFIGKVVTPQVSKL